MPGSQSARFKGAPQYLADVLRPFVQRNGPDFVWYSEEPIVKDAKLDRKLIVSQHEIVGKCRQLQENMSFNASLVSEALKLIVTDFRKDWKFTDPMVVEWVEAMTRRLRNMFAGVAQAESKAPLAAWVKLLPWHREAHGDEEGDDATQAHPVDATPAPAFESRWDRD